VHTHSHEDEWSFVLDGEVGVEIDGHAMVARAGDLVLKPRAVPHAFWNAGDAPARFLEVITPGGFEDYFVALAGVLAVDGQPDLERVAEVAARFGLDVDPTSVPRLAQTHGLVLA
jgi:gentisate 1,2-dioxygenase